MAGLAIRRRGADDSALARRAANGDGGAFAELYERHESRAFNLCYRILGSRNDAADATKEAFLGVLRRRPRVADRDFAFGSHLLTSARDACYDLIERRTRSQPRDEIPEAATPVGGDVAGAGTGFDPGDPEDDAERNVLLEAHNEEIRIANLALPERQREVLALRELEELSYDEIAELMNMNRNSVAQLISWARVNLRDALRGTALASIAASSPDCERAMPLIALEQDGQLDQDSNDAGWLGEHLMRCHTCRLGRDAMQEAGVSYRAWAPIAAGPLLFREAMAQAAELVGADWSEVAERRQGAPRRSFRWHRRRDLGLVAVLTLLLALVVLVAAAGDEDVVVPDVPAAAAEEEAPGALAAPAASSRSEKAADKGERRRRRLARRQLARRRRGGAAPAVVAPTPAEVAVAEPEPSPEPRPRRRRQAKRVAPERRPDRRGRGDVERRPERGSQDGIVPEVTPEPPPTTPEPPPPPPPGTPPEPPPPPPCSTPNCPPPPPP